MKEVKTKARKLYKLGNSTAITLPKKFLDKNELKAGDGIGIIYNSILIIATPEKRKKK